MDADDAFVSDLEATAGFLRLVARLLSRPIDAELLKLLKTPEVAELLTLANPWAKLELGRNWEAAEYENAGQEFGRLFSHPASCSLLASGWKEAADVEPAIAELAIAVAGELGFEWSPELRDLPGDHLARLLETEAWLLLNDQEAAADDFRAAALESWCPAFCERLQEVADSPIYRAAARLLAQTFEVEEAQ